MLGKKLQALMGDVHFRSDFDQALDSPEHFLAIGEHNIRQWERIEAMGEDHEERIRNILANILASRLQEEAIEKHGDTDSSSLRQVLHGWFDQSKDREFQEKLRQTTKKTLLGLDFTEEQCAAVLVHIYDKLPEMLMDGIEELVAPVHSLPRSEAQSMAMVLADMIKEEMKCR